MKVRRTTWLNYVAQWLAAALLLSHCGTDNIYEGLEEDDAAEDAAIELENGDADEAIKILEKALAKDEDDYQLISLLSSAYAQRGGISIIDLALNMAESEDDEEDSAPQNAMTALWPMLPEASASNLSDANEALLLLRSIPLESRTDSDNFKLALISAAVASLQMKALDTNGDGELSTQELSHLAAASADSIIAALQGASGALAGLDGEQAESTQQAAEKIDEIVSAVTSQAGTDNEDKIRNYFN